MAMRLVLLMLYKGHSAVAKKKLGAKRICPNCSAKFYDLNKMPVVCPKCAHSFEPAKAAKPRKEKAESLKEQEEVAVPEPAANGLTAHAVTFEEADAEITDASGARIAALDEDDEDTEEKGVILVDDDENDALLATDDEDDEDVSNMIDADITIDE